MAAHRLGHLVCSLGVIVTLFMSASAIGCASAPAEALPERSRITNVAEARVAAFRYLQEHNLSGSLSDGMKSHAAGWTFVVTHDDSLIVGGHFFLHVLPDGTVNYQGGA
jgi:hypothetical protein